MKLKEGRVIKTVQNKEETIVFRYPRWQDVPAYVEMCNILHDERLMAYHAETDLAKGCERMSSILVALETCKQAHLLMETKGKIIGEGNMTAGVAPIRADGQPLFPFTGVLGIKVIGEYRRRGLGTEMMFLLEEEARKLGLRRIYLHVWALNDAARYLYQKVGYREVGRVPDWYSVKDEDGSLIYSDRIEMIKDIKG